MSRRLSGEEASELAAFRAVQQAVGFAHSMHFGKGGPQTAVLGRVVDGPVVYAVVEMFGRSDSVKEYRLIVAPIVPERRPSGAIPQRNPRGRKRRKSKGMRRGRFDHKAPDYVAKQSKAQKRRWARLRAERKQSESPAASQRDGFSGLEAI